ncbi:unnamed protein product [Effrenium voratum]|nr:unnamed protein product [Effrenium voratum]
MEAAAMGAPSFLSPGCGASALLGAAAVAPPSALPAEEEMPPEASEAVLAALKDALLARLGEEAKERALHWDEMAYGRRLLEILANTAGVSAGDEDGKRSISKMSDFDLALDPSCERQNAAVDWQVVRHYVWENLGATTAAEEELREWMDRGRPSKLRPTWGGCNDALRLSFQEMEPAWNIDSRYSSWQSDCFLGWLSVVLSDAVCSLHGALLGDEESGRSWPAKWTKMQLELEGLFFYVDLPWHVLLSSRWPLPQLMSLLGRAVAWIASPAANRCDEANSFMDDLLLDASPGWWQTYHPDNADTALIPLHIAEEFLALQAAQPLLEPQRCSFGVLAALLSVALWALKANQLEGFPDGPVGRRPPEVLVSGNAQQMAKLWEERTPQFFYDLLTTRFRITEILEQLAAVWPRPAMSSPSRPAAIPAKAARRVLFLGGGDTTYQWGSFTVRGRQVARGFRQQGVDARAWNSPCEAWCRREPDGWVPTSFVHVKYLCLCAALGWPRAAHIYDPVDIFGMPNNATLIDAVLVQTALAKSDLEEHPPLRQLRHVAVHWLPLHHSNFHNLRVDPSEPINRVGVHTVHADQELEGWVNEVLAGEGPGAPRFVHLDPMKLFEPNEGKITTPQHTDALYQQLTTLQVGFAKQSGCRSEWWSCSRWKTGQRLVNMLSVGIPTIVWGDARGHLDVLEGLWPPDEDTEREQRDPSSVTGLSACHSQLGRSCCHHLKRVTNRPFA